MVAYYPEVIAGNCPEVQQTKFIYDYVGLHRPKDFTKKIFTILRSYFPDITKGEVKEATDAAYAEYAHHMSLIRKEGERIIDQARAEGRRIIVLAGRPYHVDPEVNHGIDTLITRAGAAVITEDSISNRVEKFPTTVLEPVDLPRPPLRGGPILLRPSRTWTWCSWSPSAAAWTPSPPTRPGRSCRRAASCTPS